jgi:hypothetical protein
MIAVSAGCATSAKVHDLEEVCPCFNALMIWEQVLGILPGHLVMKTRVWTQRSPRRTINASNVLKIRW